MGKKVHPLAFRRSLNKKWTSQWFGQGEAYRKYLLEDFKLRKMIMGLLKPAGVSKVVIERNINQVSVTVFVSRPGVVIGRAGSGLEELRKTVEKQLGQKVKLNVEEIKKPDLDAYLVARNIADQVEKRMPVRRVLAQTGDRVMQAGAKGVKILVSGRIGGSEIARREKVVLGTVPLQTLRADIDYAAVDARTATAGITGVKVWISRDPKSLLPAALGTSDRG
jgi:small subunit ribosomal protein S3